MRSFVVMLGSWLLLLAGLRAEEKLPPKPEAYFNDYAHLVSPAFAQEMEAKLKKLELDSTNQILVAIFPKMESQDSVESYTYRLNQSWKVGQKGKNNGATLFVFVEDHKDFIQTNYGLEGALPDATCKDILIDKVQPAFRETPPNYEGGLRAAVDSMIQATRGEYRGSGKTARQVSDRKSNFGFNLIFYGLLILFAVVSAIYRRKHGIIYGSNGSGFVTGWLLSSLFSGSTGSSSSSGGSSGGDFLGGGGIGGGGGAGGDW